MITSRDKVALDFINQFKMVTPTQVDKVAYNNLKVCYNRLNRLYGDRLLYKTQNTVNRGFIYSTTRIRTLKQFMHNCIRTEFYLRLLQLTKVEVVMVEQQFGSVRPDLIVAGTYNYEPYFFSIEVETNANHSSVNYDKYFTFFLSEWRTYFNEKPVVIYVTDKNIDDNKIKFEYRHIKTDLSNFKDIFR